ncbi:MAG: hypothetical protein V4719_30640, partial [Planctomycetota bacterium]
VQYLDMHADLIRFAIEPLTCEELSATISRETVQERRNRLRHVIKTTVASVACLIGIVFGLSLILTSLNRPQPIAQVQPILKPIPLATVTEISQGAGWQSAAKIVGQKLFGNDRIELGQGRVLIEFVSGVQLRFQGPGVLAIDSPFSVRMFGGRALANVPQAGKGFTIRAGDAIVIDYGTEFLIDASGDQAAAVAVRQGQVGIGFQAEQTSPPVALMAGGAVHMDGKSRALTSVGYDPEVFQVFDLDMARITNLSGQLRYVLEPTPTFPLNYVTSTSEGLLLRECVRRELSGELLIEEPFGQYRVPKGTFVDSFIVHYSPDRGPNGKIVGNVTFEQPILAITAETKGLDFTDRILAIAPSSIPDGSRGMNFYNTDKIQLSADRRTVSFCIATTQHYADQFRILVQSPDSK